MCHRGSALGPLLFFYAAAHIADIDGIINHDLQLLTSWARKWLVTFNPLKTEGSFLL